MLKNWILGQPRSHNEMYEYILYWRLRTDIFLCKTLFFSVLDHLIAKLLNGGKQSSLSCNISTLPILKNFDCKQIKIYFNETVSESQKSFICEIQIYFAQAQELFEFKFYLYVAWNKIVILENILQKYPFYGEIFMSLHMKEIFEKLLIVNVYVIAQLGNPSQCKECDCTMLMLEMLIWITRQKTATTCWTATKAFCQTIFFFLF